MKKLVFLFAMLITVATTAMLASCSSEDEPSGDLVFEAGFSAFSGSGQGDEVKTQMKEIQQIYLSALGVNDATFTMKGKEQECKDKIIAACKNAEKEIERNTWNCTFTFTVFYANKMTTIYSYTYPKK